MNDIFDMFLAAASAVVSSREVLERAPICAMI